MEDNLDLFCNDLTSQPVVEHKILVTGATGYIGGELVAELVGRGYQVRVMVRSIYPELREQWPTVEIVIADVLDYTELNKALNGIDIAYYFIHSLHFDKEFKEIDSQAALNFQKAAEENNLKRIIYLGSLGNPEHTLSRHLTSRLKVADELKKGKIPVTFLRAAVIIGSGSASYKIIKHLILNFPFFILPTWANSKCQPIAIRDVIKYLVGCLENEATTGKTFDIGGHEILTYRMMMKIQANVLNKKTVFINSFFTNSSTYAKIAGKFTPVSTRLIKVLFESCNNDVVCLNTDIKDLIPFQTLSYEEALRKALIRESQKEHFIKKKNFEAQAEKERMHLTSLNPPDRGKGFLSDVRYFLLNKPALPTLINFNIQDERENYSYRIKQRLGVEVSRYRILNIHKIGINAPAKYIYEELLKWNGDSTCWPNHIAKVVKINERLENLDIYLFGLTKFPSWIKYSLLGRSFIPLFKLNAITINSIPDPAEPDNARYLLYTSSGGYPIGVFTMYVRSSIANQKEKELSQLFLMVGFNFYGKENWSKRNLINRLWEGVHNRVTSNVLNRLKQLCEWRFEKIKHG